MECSHGQPWQEVCSAGLCNIGWLLLITANLWSSPAGFITVLLMGQFFTGCGLGWGMLLCMLYTLGFAIGWASILNCFSCKPEAFLLDWCRWLNWGCAIFVSGTYNWFAELVHSYGAWWTFGILNITSSACVAVFLPETRGKKLEVIEDQLQNRYRPCVWR